MPLREEFARLIDRGAPKPPHGGGCVQQPGSCVLGDVVDERVDQAGREPQVPDIVVQPVELAWREFVSHGSFPFFRSADADGHPRGFNNPYILYSR